MARVLIGIGWYRSEQWPDVQRIMEDKMDETYTQWLAHATDLETALKKEGADVVRHPMDLDDFQIWCRRKGKKPDASARSDYVAEKIRR